MAGIGIESNIGDDSQIWKFTLQRLHDAGTKPSGL